MRVHEVINENSASAPIFCHSNLIETSPIGAEKFCSVDRIGGDKFLPLSYCRWLINSFVLRSFQTNPIGADKFISAHRRAVKIYQRHSKNLMEYTLL